MKRMKDRLLTQIRRAVSLLAMSWLVMPMADAATATRVSAFEYDPASGLLIKEIIEPDKPTLCLVTLYTYDAFGNKTSTTTRNCDGSTGSMPGTNSEAAAPAAGNDALIETRTSTTTYDTRGRFPIRNTNALGQTETQVWNGEYGTPTSLTGPNGLTTTWTYDSFGRKLTEARADGTSTQWSYERCATAGVTCPAIANTSNGATGQYRITVIQAGAPYQRSYYDPLGRVYLTETQSIDNKLIYTQTQYDHLGRAFQTSRPYYANASISWKRVWYDLINRPTRMESLDSNGATIVEKMSYDGLTMIAINGKNQSKTEVKNSQGQLVSVTDTQSKSMTYQYDAFGNLIKTIDAAGNTTTINYDLRGRKTSMNDPDQGLWSYSYDVLGQLKKQKDAKNQIVTMSYDKLGRMTQRNEPDLISTWSYDTCDTSLNPGGKCVGKPVKETADNGYTRTYVYDTYGRATAELDNVDTGYGVTKSYDSVGRVESMVYPTGFQITNVYSNTGYLSQVKNSSSGVVYWRANTLDAEGHVTKETYRNGLINLRNYDPNTGHLLQSQSGTATSSSSVMDQSYVYDKIGNLTQRYDAVTELNESFGYDSLNRLTVSNAQAGTGPLTRVLLSYDAIGNILSKSDVGTYSYGVLVNGVLTKPHAVTKIMMNDGVTEYASYTYDANGNQLTGAGRTMSWNSWNMPNQIVGTTPGKSTPEGIASSSVGFVYNSAHERVKQTLPDGTVIYNISPRVDTGIHVEKRLKTVSGVTTTTFVHSLYAGSYPFGTYTTSTTSASTATTVKVRYFHTDHLGSIVAITDETGTVTDRRNYDAWGKRRNANGTAMTNAFVTPEERHGFTGHEELNDVGLIHMNGRMYDPATGRFVSADPTVQYADDLQNYNRYSYINNNPLSAVDASGFGFASKLFKGVGKVFKGIGKAIKSVLKNPYVRLGVSIYVGYQIGIAGGGIFENAVANGAAGGFAAGLIQGRGDLRAAINGAITGAAMGYVGGQWNSGTFGNIAGHAVVGCGSSVMDGGECGSGALAGGFSGWADPMVGRWGPVGGTVASAVIGGTASVLGGGKFENGAMTGAFGYLFNCMQHECFKFSNPEEGPYALYGNSNGHWLQKDPYAALLEVGYGWESAGETSQIGIGNGSLEYGGTFPPHGAHREGYDVDIRPLRVDGSGGAVTWKSSSYDRAATQRFVDALISTGKVETILFNDPNIKGVKPWSKHDDHLHVRFRKSR